ncbi:unnamed protein product [Aspergillus oryzae]|nr:unnamed protein product [Aspergillus oryzae]GMF95007.1 unnamed protein product [Aspergillus oryzae]GMG15208.1 unnamed protein product [Aspergillus oryzae]GMG38285.1 unnamed protein product [Aspergillus oryzae]GMG54962.1 unnamed protein product [Aspergillus oryzae var. brunneus]
MAEMPESGELDYNVIEDSQDIVYKHEKKRAAEPDMQKATCDTTSSSSLEYGLDYPAYWKLSHSWLASMLSDVAPRDGHPSLI